jgi:hypothetical protein
MIVDHEEIWCGQTKDDSVVWDGAKRRGGDEMTVNVD